jgi:hypothetical protein
MCGGANTGASWWASINSIWRQVSVGRKSQGGGPLLQEWAETDWGMCFDWISYGYYMGTALLGLQGVVFCM